MEVQRAVKDVSLHCFLLCDRINSSHSNKQGAQILPHCIFFKRLYQLKYNQQKMLWKLTDVKVVALVLPTANCINRNGSSPSKDLEYVRSLQWFAVKHIFKYFFCWSLCLQQEPLCGLGLQKLLKTCKLIFCLVHMVAPQIRKLLYTVKYKQ